MRKQLTKYQEDVIVTTAINKFAVGQSNGEAHRNMLESEELTDTQKAELAEVFANHTDLIEQLERDMMNLVKSGLNFMLDQENTDPSAPRPQDLLTAVRQRLGRLTYDMEPYDRILVQTVQVDECYSAILVAEEDLRLNDPAVPMHPSHRTRAARLLRRNERDEETDTEMEEEEGI